MKHLAFQIEKTHRRERPQQLVAQIGGKVIVKVCPWCGVGLLFS